MKSRILHLFLVPLMLLAVSCAEDSPSTAEEAGLRTQEGILLGEGDIRTRDSPLYRACGALVDGLTLAIDGVLPATHQPNQNLPAKYNLRLESVKDGSTTMVVGTLETRQIKDEVVTSYLSEDQIVSVCNLIQQDWASLSESTLDDELENSCKVSIAEGQPGTFVDLRSSQKNIYTLRWGLSLLVQTCENPVAHKALQNGVSGFLQIFTQ